MKFSRTRSATVITLFNDDKVNVRDSADLSHLLQHQEDKILTEQESTVVRFVELSFYMF